MRALKHLFGDRTSRALRRLVARERMEMFRKAADYANYELVSGDILEFGVFTGRTLAALADANARSQYPVPFARNVHGFDSFTGLPESADMHPRWRTGVNSANHLVSTPGTRQGDRVSADGVHALFSYLRLSPPILHEGPFDETIRAVVPSECPAVAIVHIDCDLYESAIIALSGIEPALQDGTVLLFDDWFHYKANPKRGEQRAFAEFLDANAHWQAADYGSYATFCKAFILSRR